MKSIALVAVAALGLTACSDAWLEEYKLDQNRPSDVSMGVLLPSAQANYGMVQGDDATFQSSSVIISVTSSFIDTNSNFFFFKQSILWLITIRFNQAPKATSFL